ncbi:hypothetical protein GN956_G19823 [Arapaima gigas]
MVQTSDSFSRVSLGSLPPPSPGPQAPAPLIFRTCFMRSTKDHIPLKTNRLDDAYDVITTESPAAWTRAQNWCL